uniref:L-glutamate gamma-semialdehyde dehydrogenase n=1 Tax=Glossina pallidipes TaxID=7398 RepID=A0A1A9Z0V7_GLOPL
MNLIYENGVLTQASTRGNGMFGEDVTKNALTIQTIPYNLKLHNIASKYIEIRGEVFINKSKFCHLNEIAKLNNRKPFSNPRNAASGSLRQINPKVTESRYLMFYGYGIGFSKGYNLPNSQYKRLQTLKTWGIPINNYAKICIGVPQILSFYDKIKKIRKNLDFEIDGIVIKVDSVLHQDKIGFVTKAPKWAVAYKFPALEVVTQIIGIDFTVGRTGTITPIAQVKPILPQSYLRSRVTSAWSISETEIVPKLLNLSNCDENTDQKICKLSRELVTGLRKKKKKYNKEQIIQDLLQEFPLSSQEGVALMCLAEALLRVPDSNTRDALIKDKIKNKNWKSHFGTKKSLFVNSTIWGLCLTNTIIKKYTEKDLFYSLNKIIKRIGEPIIRKSINVAMQLMGKQFVVGEDIQQALKNTQNLEKRGFTYSYDMLGESAVTEEDAQSYMSSYEHAIHCIGKASLKKGIYNGAGISIKLSALYPRYFRTHYNQIMSELYPRLHTLTVLARNYDIGMNIDAEEASRLEISLDLLERLCCEPSLSGWNGIGFVIQAYQKRCMYVIDELVDIAKRTKRRLMIRLVKGAYWDSEIKNTQIEGIENYPVFTRKVYTDVSYLACAKKLLSKSNYIYPQFATHNAQTVASIYHFAGNNYYPGQYEFQCLHGMGEQLYEQVVGDSKLNRPCRIYAPVGTHKTLLAYLVRRILENGANNSFINRISDHSIPIEKLILNPVLEVKQIAQKENAVIGTSHPNIPKPINLYGLERKNSIGLNLANENVLAKLSSNLFKNNIEKWKIYPKISGKMDKGPIKIITNPANKNDIIGECQQSTIQDVESALVSSTKGIKTWSSIEPVKRSKILQESAKKIENNLEIFIGLLVRESGKTFSNAISEIREAVDFLRYYACQITNFNNKDYCSLGCILCISPWNFPLAIFIGQISAALAAGNVVIAKPAEQTPIVAYKAIQLMLDSGVPADALQFLPGSGKIIGDALSKDHRIHGVMFTGSTQVARLLQKNLSNRLGKNKSPVPLIAETGGLNAMIVDSSALTEQVIGDVIISAFDSAGQRCSALRLLCIQEDVADRTLHMLKGAINTYNVGNPDHLEVDIGPVIDKNAKFKIDQHILNMQKNNHTVWQSEANRSYEYDLGNFVLPTLIELDNINQITEEIFGPVLHVIRYKYKEMDKIIQEINSTGYGLTLGIHSRIEEKIDKILHSVKVGNIYINRNIVGAVVGVQPFGGENLSGTGPKAGVCFHGSSEDLKDILKFLSEKPGPVITVHSHVTGERKIYLERFLIERTISTNTTAAGGNTTLLNIV